MAQTIKKAQPMRRLRNELRPGGRGIFSAVTLVGPLYPAIGGGLNLGKANIAFGFQI
jgi:hypothetical protein